MPSNRNASVIPLFLLVFVAVASCGTNGPAADSARSPGEAATAGAAQATSQAAPIPPLFDTAAHVGAWVELWGTYDLSRVDDLFLAGPDTTYFSSEKQGLIVGFDAVREHHAGFGFVEGGVAPAQELWVEDVDARVFGESVVVNAIWYFGDRAAAGGADSDSLQKGPMTSVWVLDRDTYKIAHMHFASYTPEG